MHWIQISENYESYILVLTNLYVKTRPLGVIQKPRGHNFAHFWPPTYLRGHFLCTKRGQKWQILDHLPTPSCPRGYWMPPNDNFWWQSLILTWNELCNVDGTVIANVRVINPSSNAESKAGSSPLQGNIFKFPNFFFGLSHCGCGCRYKEKKKSLI